MNIKIGNKTEKNIYAPIKNNKIYSQTQAHSNGHDYMANQLLDGNKPYLFICSILINIL